MKFRRGFVSNSSTTSFCIFGTIITEKYLEDFAKKAGKHDWDWESILMTAGLNFHGIYLDADEYVVGLDFTSIDRNETRAQFESRVHKLLKAIVDKNIKKADLGVHEGGWYDG